MPQRNIMKILPGTNPILRQKAETITDPANPELTVLIQQMVQTLRASKGVGLAAPQVGQPIRLFIVEVDYILYVMINPVMKHISRDMITMEEGCLSFPGIFKPIARSKKVTVSYFNQEGKKTKLKAKGLLARAIQHEYDHLDGVLFIDRCEEKK